MFTFQLAATQSTNRVSCLFGHLTVFVSTAAVLFLLEADIFFSPDKNSNLNLPISRLHEKAWLPCGFALNFVFQMNAANKWNDDLLTTTESHFDINHF